MNTHNKRAVPIRKNEELAVSWKYKELAHILNVTTSCGADENQRHAVEELNDETKKDLLTNYIPFVPAQVKSISLEQYKAWVDDTSKSCAEYNLSAHSYKYKKRKMDTITELITFIISLPYEKQQLFNFSDIQPKQIVMFMNYFYIPLHGKEDKNISINSNTRIIDRYIISDSSIRTTIGAISSFLSARYGRVDHWSIQNSRGNPCKSRLIIDFKNSITKVNDARGVKVTHATPITADLLIKLIDGLDQYNNTLKGNYLGENRNPTLSEILEILLIERDICLYIYMFISLQRCGDATKLTHDNIVFGSSKLTDVIDYALFTIYPHQMKKQSWENKSAIRFEIKKNHNWHLKDGQYEAGMPNTYCLIHRYTQFKQLCVKFGYDKNKMISIFPVSKNKRLDFSKNQDYQSAAKKFTANLKKVQPIIGPDIQLYKLTLHSFRRGGIQNRHLNGENKEDVMKQAGHASKEMNRLYRDNRVIRGKNPYANLPSVQEERKRKKKKQEEMKDIDDNNQEECDHNDQNDQNDQNDTDTGSDEYNEAMEGEACEICNRCDNEEEMLICDCCDRGFHYRCIGLSSIPRLSSIPEEEEEEQQWYCEDCYAEPKSEIKEGYEIHVGRLIKYRTKSRGKWQHACVEFYNHKTRKHTLVLGEFKSEAEAKKRLDDRNVRRVKNFDMKRSFEQNLLKFTDKDQF